MGAVKVRVHTGALDATDALARVPPDRWAELVQVRRSFLTTNLPYDCRCLLQFVAEATPMLAPLGYTDTTDFLRRGLELDPELVDWALVGLERLKPDEPIPYETAVRSGRHGGDRRSPAARNQDYGVILKQGNSRSYLLARLERDDKKHPGLAARVRAGELKANTAARLAGIIRTKTPLEQLDHWWAKASSEDRLTFLRKVRVS